jgi:phosphate:Na+ symporter
MSGSDLLLTLLGAVALLLWGVRMVRTGMTRAFSGPLRRLLGRASRNRVSAFAIGAGVTAVLQSATATALLVASFAGQGLVALPVALALMLGADVGTTLIAQLFAFDIKWLWAVFVMAGVIAFNSSDDQRSKAAGRIAIGLGLMLLALTIMAMASAAMRESSVLKAVLGALAAEPLLAVLVGALVTWLAHSSLAIVLFIMSLASAGSVTPSLAVALVLGANVGSSVAPLAALSGQPAAARRVALGNLIARTTIALALLPFLALLAGWVGALSADPARQVLHGHTLFNVLVAAIWLPLLSVLAQLSQRLLPDAPVTGLTDAPQNLDASVLDTPSEALACAMRETLNVGDLVLDMLRRSKAAIEGRDPQLIKEIERDDDRVDNLHTAIKHYLVQASKTEMSEEESRHYIEVLSFNNNLEHIGDIIDKNLMELAQKRLKKGVRFSTEGLAELHQFHDLVVSNMRLALNVFATRDAALARRLVQEKANIRAREFEAADRHYARLREGRPESMESSSIHLDIVRDLKRINSHLTSVAYPILERSGDLTESRLKTSAAATAAGSQAVKGHVR